MFTAITHHPELAPRRDDAGTLAEAVDLAERQQWQGDPPLVHGPNGEVWRATWDDQAVRWTWQQE